MDPVKQKEKTVSDEELENLVDIDKQAEILHRFISLAEKIKPQLEVDGTNFNQWSKSLTLAWTTYFMGDPDYFEQTTTDTNVKRNIVALSFIQHSVNTRAYESVTSNINAYNACIVYKALKDRFNRPSWSSIILNANVIFQNNGDRLHDINNFSLKVNEAIRNLENLMGPMNGDTIATLAIFYAVPTMKHHITAAINTLMATNPNLAVRPDDLLNMIRQINTASPSFDHTTEIARINAASRFGQRNTNDNLNANRQHTSHNRSAPPKSQSYTKRTRHYNANNPCHYCGEVGHWSPDCPTKAKAANARNRSRQSSATIASMGIVPTLEEDDALLDSGATHSVVGNISLFTSLKSTDMVLSVASSHSFKVNGIGEIQLNTPNGTIKIRNVLYCKHISGTILSLGHLLNEGFKVNFQHEDFFISKDNILFQTCKRDNRWFIPFHHGYPSSIRLAHITANSPVSILNDNQTDDINLLWHRRLGHLSIRNLNLMMKLNAATGIPKRTLLPIKLCHPCSIAKSQHRPVKSPSRKIIQQP
ncbi:hypothetical protein O181_124269, partial [Austropuccinia psidii MF-1]|nr:hypothetical protein [Austropuccinia psidii MF-1]